jgi:hypothetical protein
MIWILLHLFFSKKIKKNQEIAQKDTEIAQQKAYFLKQLSYLTQR